MQDTMEGMSMLIFLNLFMLILILPMFSWVVDWTVISIYVVFRCLSDFNFHLLGTSTWQSRYVRSVLWRHSGWILKNGEVRDMSNLIMAREFMVIVFFS